MQNAYYITVTDNKKYTHTHTAHNPPSLPPSPHTHTHTHTHTHSSMGTQMQVVAVWCPLVSVPPRRASGQSLHPVYCASASRQDKCRAQHTVTASAAEDGCPDSELPRHMSQFVKDNKFKKKWGSQTQQSTQTYSTVVLSFLRNITPKQSWQHESSEALCIRMLSLVLGRLRSHNHYFKNVAL